MLLENKVALIYGGGGSIGGAVASAFAREGAKVYLVGRTQAKLDAVADKIRTSGGAAQIAVVDALDEQAVDAFVNSVAEQTGRIDISFNLIGYDDIQEPLMEISVDDFLQPIANAMRSQFLTTRAAARHMIKRGTGVVLTFGGGGPQTLPGLGGFKVALDAIEGLRRQWAIELGKQSIRIVTLKTGGVLETLPDEMPGRQEIVAQIEKAASLNYTEKLADVGDVAAFVASDLARTITATEVNISCGAIVD